MNDERIFQIGLSFINGIGNLNAKKLLAYIGSVEGIFKEKKQNLLKIPGIGTQLADEISGHKVFKLAEEELAFIDKQNITTFFYLDKDYPARLKQCEDSPIILYYKGNANLNQPKILSIVGTRKATQYGLENCKLLISSLVEKGHEILIVSGLAYGIDISAHKNALKMGLETVAVLGHGLNTLYPASHKGIANDIILQGGLLSELPSSALLDPAHFVKRNRIIAGLADATIVIESGSTGGSLITAKLANSYNRDVFAFPGRIGDRYSEGCNHLIKTNQAALIENARDIEYIMGWEIKKNEEPVQAQLFVELSEEEKVIVDFLREQGKTSIDIISIAANMPVSKVSSILLKLEFSGVIISYPGKMYGTTR
ncbi:MAG: DNA-processing protein DprA [Bacteroidales bacterium]